MMQRFFDDLDTIDKELYDKLNSIGMTDLDILERITGIKADILLKRTSFKRLDNLIKALRSSETELKRIIEKGKP